jgi:hypothetical protein
MSTGKVAPEVGLEPTTTRLTAACSTIELLWIPVAGADGNYRVSVASKAFSRILFSKLRRLIHFGQYQGQKPAGHQSGPPGTTPFCPPCGTRHTDTRGNPGLKAGAIVVHGEFEVRVRTGPRSGRLDPEPSEDGTPNAIPASGASFNDSAVHRFDPPAGSNDGAGLVVLEYRLSGSSAPPGDVKADEAAPMGTPESLVGRCCCDAHSKRSASPVRRTNGAGPRVESHHPWPHENSPGLQAWAGAWERNESRWGRQERHPSAVPTGLDTTICMQTPA